MITSAKQCCEHAFFSALISAMLSVGCGNSAKKTNDFPDADLPETDASHEQDASLMLPETLSRPGLWLSDASSNHVLYANDANDWSIMNRGEQVFDGMLMYVTWGQVMPNSEGPLSWSVIGNRLDYYGTQTPPLQGAVSVRDKFWHRIAPNGTTNHDGYQSCIPEDLVEYSSPGFTDGYISANDTAAFTGTFRNGKKYRNEAHRWVVLDDARNYVKYAAKRWSPKVQTAYERLITDGGSSTNLGLHPNLRRFILTESSTSGVSNLNDLITLGYPDRSGLGYADILVNFAQHARTHFPTTVEIASNMNWVPPNGRIAPTLQDRVVGGIGREDDGFRTPLMTLSGGGAHRRVGLFAQDLVGRVYLSRYATNVYPQFARYAGDATSPTSVQVTGETWRAFRAGEFTSYRQLLRHASNIGGPGVGIRQLYLLIRDTAFVPNMVAGKNYHNLVWTAIRTESPTGYSFLPY